MASATDAAAVRRHDHDQFVDRFLSGLTNALQMHQGQRATGVTQRIAGIAAAGRSIKTSQKVVDARMALGADDALYLQSGLGLLWAGDDNLDDEHLLFPSSMGNAAVQESTKDALKSGMVVHLNQQIDQLLGALAERLPALVHVLSLPEVGGYVRDDLQKAALLANAPQHARAARGGSGQGAATAARLGRARGRACGRGSSACSARTRRPSSRSSSRGAPRCRGCTCAATTRRRARWRLPTRTQTARVDVALARDWSSMDSVMRGARAYKAMNQNTAEKNTPGDGAPTYTGGTPTPAPPRLEQGDVATPGIGPRLPTAPTGEVAGAAAAGGDDAVVAAPPKKARAGEWMAGLLDLVADVGAHSSKTAGLQRSGTAEEHRIERPVDQATGSRPDDVVYSTTITRAVALTLSPLGGQASLSMALAASPLWHDELVNRLGSQDALPTALLTADRMLDRLDAATEGDAPTTIPGARLTPTTAEVRGVWNPTTGDVLQGRATNHTVVRSLYDDNLGVHRKTPEEIEPNAWLPNKLPYRTAQDPPDAPGLRGLGGRLNIHNSLRRGAATTSVLRPWRTQDGQSGYADGDNRFVSYALQRGLTTSYGPDEVPTDDAALNQTHTPYWRGTSVQLSTDAAARAPRALPPTAHSPALTRVPDALVSQWQKRDRDAGTKATREGLQKIVRMADVRDAAGAWRTTEVQLWHPNPLTDEKEQSTANTLRAVRWAPLAMGDKEQARVTYGAAAIAACATATYEHLLATLSDNEQSGGVGQLTPVAVEIRPAMRAALKLRQLPHMLAFDAEMSHPAVRDDGEYMQKLMSHDAPVPIFSYRTLMPTRRVVGDSVWETMPPAFSGVWSEQPRTPVARLVRVARRRCSCSRSRCTA